MDSLYELSILKSLLEFWLVVSFIFKKFWWAFLPYVLAISYYIWLHWKREKELDAFNYVLLAVTVPPDNEKNPKAMEQVFAGMYGMKMSPNFVEKYFLGKVQPPISFEIVGINGHVHFLVRTPDFFRDLVEANIYAQYPDAEIVEVEDYTKFAPDRFPDDKYDCFGTDFILEKEDAYPIRTYRHFADEIEKGFIDPVAVLSEAIGRLLEGEQVWLQIIIQPASDDWKKAGEKLVAKLIKKKQEKVEDIVQQTAIKGWHGLEKGVESILGVPQPEIGEKGEELISWMQYLSPGEREIVEAIESNIAKTGFEVKFRFIYIARKEVYNRKRGVNPIEGALRLFHTHNLNGFKKHKKTKTQVDYFQFRIPRRQRRIMNYYKKRRIDRGARPFVLNIEELATIYHFPYSSVKAPSIGRTEAKKGEAPTNLPIT